MSGEKKALNIPNVLSAYRIVAVPAIVWSLLAAEYQWFAALILANLLTDAVDGMIARLLHQESELGARLDSMGDVATYALGLAGLLVFQREFVAAHQIELVGLAILYTIPQMVSLCRFRRPISMHLYSSKVTSVAQGAFLIALFFARYVPPLSRCERPLFYTACAVTLVAAVEELVVLFLLPKPRTNARGLYWVLKCRGG